LLICFGGPALIGLRGNQHILPAEMFIEEPHGSIGLFLFRESRRPGGFLEETIQSQRPIA